MTSPADELRGAATKLRETAEGTTPTPWRVHLHYFRKNPSVLAGAELETPVHTYGISLKRPHLLADARWKALASPALAEPLATWLEAVAKDIEITADARGWVGISPTHPALAVARALNGGQQS